MPVFKITGYSVRFTNLVPRYGFVLLYTEGEVSAKARIEFVDSWVGEPLIVKENFITAYFKYEHIDRFIELLKSEENLYFMYDEQFKVCMLSTNNVPTGEEEKIPIMTWHFRYTK